MDPQLMGWIGIGLLFLLLLMRTPVAFALGAVGVIGFWVVSGTGPAMKIAGMVPYSTVATYNFSVMPLFIIMGYFVYHSGFTTDIYRSARFWIGRIPGGLAHATVIAGAAFGAASGSSFASCATLAKVTIPEMIRFGIDRRLAFGVVAATGTIAAMIPPSTLMVIYGMITEQSIGKLLIAGIIPGLVAAANYMIVIYIVVKLNPKLAPRLTEKVSWKQRLISLKSSWGIITIFVFVMGGIYTGVFTPTEAGAVGAVGTFFMALALRKMNFAIIACAFIFARFMAVSRLPIQMSDFLVQLEVHRIWILLSVMGMYILLGFFFDMIAAMFITLPIILPAITGLGYDPIWFGVLMVHLCEVSQITPPFGLNLFILKGTLPDANLNEVIRGIIPFFIMDIVTLAIYIAFPQLALFLPSKMM
jgi:tripartite ATP-independent transporter DctM subunit